MNNENEKFDQIASYLDGESVELDETQQELADEFRIDEKELSARLAVNVPEGAFEKALKTVNYQTQPVHWKRVRYGFYCGVQAASILVILLGLARYSYAREIFLPGWGMTYQQAIQLWQESETETVTEQTEEFDDNILGVIEEIVQEEDGEPIDDSDWLEWFQSDNQDKSLGRTDAVMVNLA